MSEEVEEKKPKAERKETQPSTKSKAKTTSEKKESPEVKKKTTSSKKTDTVSKDTAKKEKLKTSSEKKSKANQVTESANKSTESKTTKKGNSTKKANLTNKYDISKKKETIKKSDNSSKSKDNAEKKINSKDTSTKKEATKKLEKTEKQGENTSVDASEDVKNEIIEEIKQKKNKTQKGVVDNSKENNKLNSNEKDKKKENDINNESDEVEQETSLVDESKFDTVSLKEIREALENKVDKNQRKSVLKDVFINISIALLMVLYLSVIMIIYKKLDVTVLEKISKIATLTILFIGLAILEISYKKDNTKVAMNAIEVITFGASNLCLIYTIKLYIDNLRSIIGYIIIGVVAYYIVKSTLLSIFSIRKFKDENNDIKDIVAKKKKEE